VPLSYGSLWGLTIDWTAMIFYWQIQW
jgi:hypothetical protein